MSRWEGHVRLLLGFALIAEAIALNVRCELGLGPLFVVFQGLERHGLFTIGVATIVVNALLLVAAMAMRERPGLGTLGQVLLVGPLADFALLVTPPVHSTPMRAAYLGLAYLILCAGAALYLSARLGAGPYDAVMWGLLRTLRRGSLAVVRVSMEGTALLTGWLLGGGVGVGTLVIGLGIGPGLALGLRLLGAHPVRLPAATAGLRGPAAPAPQP